MVILLLMCFVASLLICFFAWKRIKESFCESRLFFFIGSVAYSFVFFYGAFVRIMGFEYNVAGGTGDSWVNYSFPEIYLLVLTCITFVINVAIAVITRFTKSPFTFTIIMLCCLLGLVSFCGLMFGISPILAFFGGCCAIMAYFANILHLTYKEFCVLGNIYIQMGICVLASLSSLMLYIRRHKNSNVLTGVFCVVNFLVHLMTFFVVLAHYFMPLEAAYNLDYHELNVLSSITGLSYIVVCLVVFVMLFVSDLIYNAIVYKLTEYCLRHETSKDAKGVKKC